MVENVPTSKTSLTSSVCPCGDQSCGVIEVDYSNQNYKKFNLSEISKFLRKNQRFQYLAASAMIAVIGLIMTKLFDMPLEYFFFDAAIVGIIVPVKLAYRSLKKKVLTINTLLVLATFSALIIQLYEEALFWSLYSHWEKYLKEFW